MRQRHLLDAFQMLPSWGEGGGLVAFAHLVINGKNGQPFSFQCSQTPPPSFHLKPAVTAVVSSLSPPTKGAVPLLFPLCGWFGLLCPLWSGREQKQGRIWRIGLWVTHRRPRCFETLATPAPQTDPSAAVLHYQIHLVSGLQRHVTKIQNPSDAFKSNWTISFVVFLCIYVCL